MGADSDGLTELAGTVDVLGYSMGAGRFPAGSAAFGGRCAGLLVSGGFAQTAIPR
jgi:hypothetical protein